MLGGLLFSVMDTTIVSTALVTIATDLQNFQDMYWVVLAYMLSYLGKQHNDSLLEEEEGQRLTNWTCRLRNWIRQTR